MSPRALILTIAPFVFIGANYYIITRRITIFGGQTNQRAIMLLISLIITLAIVLLQTSQFSNIKIFSIIGSIGSRLFILIPVLAVLMGIEHLITAVLLQGETKGSTTRWIITLTIFLGFLAYGLRAALNTKITKVELTTDKIPQDLKIMLVADIHVDDIFSTIHLKTLKKQIELQKPDLVLIAGDFFNRANVRHAQYYQILSDITIPMYAVEGNHDTMGKSEEKQLALRRIEDLTTIRFLRNESILLPELNLQLIGIRDKGQRQKGGINKAVWTITLQVEGQDTGGLSEVLQESNIQDWDTFNILLTHQPIELSRLANFPIDLELAGHTHNLQIRGLHFISYLINDYTYGLHSERLDSFKQPKNITEEKNAEQTAFVTQGIWTRGLPMRRGTRSEIVMIHLTAE